ncbi:ribosomal maturation YjgA family protein [Flavobacterium selenitireducens]|uniref:ribosomal maturation YjgA family protein n=1 Tax=Flavobacterium selenitireducens TaxID=2722704 RepID=UPI00168BAFF8|nr:DUF2809 domain-containing protein [Flavobacterium selenitireducens]MBD3582074.1 DUF2809 domain-containing protein [Flavobacterium selenitireducens]
MTFRLHYFRVFFAVFVVEVLIARFVHDDFVRPYLGDLLVVILIYAFVRAFLNVSVKVAALGTLAFSFLVEFLQFLQIVDWLGLRDNKVARIVIGTSFSWHDLLMYVLGIVFVLLTERFLGDQDRVRD